MLIKTLTVNITKNKKCSSHFHIKYPFIPIFGSQFIYCFLFFGINFQAVLIVVKNFSDHKTSGKKKRKIIPQKLDPRVE